MPISFPRVLPPSPRRRPQLGAGLQSLPKRTIPVPPFPLPIRSPIRPNSDPATTFPPFARWVNTVHLDRDDTAIAGCARPCLPVQRTHCRTAPQTSCAQALRGAVLHAIGLVRTDASRLGTFAELGDNSGIAMPCPVAMAPGRAPPDGMPHACHRPLPSTAIQEMQASFQQAVPCTHLCTL